MNIVRKGAVKKYLVHCPVITNGASAFNTVDGDEEQRIIKGPTANTSWLNWYKIQLLNQVFQIQIMKLTNIIMSVGRDYPSIRYYLYIEKNNFLTVD